MHLWEPPYLLAGMLVWQQKKVCDSRYSVWFGSLLCRCMHEEMLIHKMLLPIRPDYLTALLAWDTVIPVSCSHKHSWWGLVLAEMHPVHSGCHGDFAQYLGLPFFLGDMIIFMLRAHTKIPVSCMDILVYRQHPQAKTYGTFKQKCVVHPSFSIHIWWQYSTAVFKWITKIWACI